jgi:8-oxo-dGTP diphosphatase
MSQSQMSQSQESQSQESQSQESQPPVVAIAILYQVHPSGSGDPQYLMQLRDNIPGIVYPGYWGFFGGHLEPGEAPEAALRRELLEEIEYQAGALTPFGCYTANNVIRHVFAGPLITPIEQLVLHEGWDLGFFDRAAIQAGAQFSDKAGMKRPLAPVHQQILRDHLQTWPG